MKTRIRGLPDLGRKQQGNIVAAVLGIAMTVIVGLALVDQFDETQDDARALTAQTEVLNLVLNAVNYRVANDDFDAIAVRNLGLAGTTNATYGGAVTVTVTTVAPGTNNRLAIAYTMTDADAGECGQVETFVEGTPNVAGAACAGAVPVLTINVV